MRAFLHWLDDERTTHRSTMVVVVAALGLMAVGALVGVAVGAPGKGAVVGACGASVVGTLLGIAAFAAGGRSKHDTSVPHLARGFAPGAATTTSSTTQAGPR